MNHLTVQAMYDLVDNRLDEKRKYEVEVHLGGCETCRRAVALERSVHHVIKNAPLIKAPNGLSAVIMVRLSTRTRDPLSVRILSKLGSFAAMALVLGVIGFAIVSVSDMKLKSMGTTSYVTRLAAPISEAYSKGVQTFTHRTSVITQSIESKSGAQFWNTIFIILLTFVVLAAADKMFGKRLTKLRS